MMITPELVQQMAVAVSPASPGGRRITPEEFQRIMGILTGTAAGIMAAGAVGMLVSAITKRFSETVFEVREVAGIPVPVLRSHSSPEIFDHARYGSRVGTFLREWGFKVRVLFPKALTVVDFEPGWDLRREIERRIEEAGIEDRYRAGIETTGSFEVREDASMGGEVPLILVRKEEMAFKIAEARIPQGLRITEVHPHTYDTKVATLHIHFEGSARRVGPEEMANFILELYAIPTMFLEMVK